MREQFKAVCIESNLYGLTVGKVYDCLPDTDILDPLYYQVLDNHGKWSWYSKFMFKTITENRNSKLNELGI